MLQQTIGAPFFFLYFSGFFQKKQKKKHGLGMKKKTHKSERKKTENVTDSDGFGFRRVKERPPSFRNEKGQKMPKKRVLLLLYMQGTSSVDQTANHT